MTGVSPRSGRRRKTWTDISGEVFGRFFVELSMESGAQEGQLVRDDENGAGQDESHSGEHAGLAVDDYFVGGTRIRSSGPWINQREVQSDDHSEGD